MPFSRIYSPNVDRLIIRSQNPALLPSFLLCQQSASFLPLLHWDGKPQHKVDNDSRQQGQCQKGWPISIIEPCLPPLPDTLCPPVECPQGVYHCTHRNDCEDASTDLAHAIAKVEESNG